MNRVRLFVHVNRIHSFVHVNRLEMSDRHVGTKADVWRMKVDSIDTMHRFGLFIGLTMRSIISMGFILNTDSCQNSTNKQTNVFLNERAQRNCVGSGSLELGQTHVIHRLGHDSSRGYMGRVLHVLAHDPAPLHGDRIQCTARHDVPEKRNQKNVHLCQCEHHVHEVDRELEQDPDELDQLHLVLRVRRAHGRRVLYFRDDPDLDRVQAQIVQRVVQERNHGKQDPRGPRVDRDARELGQGLGRLRGQCGQHGDRVGQARGRVRTRGERDLALERVLVELVDSIRRVPKRRGPPLAPVHESRTQELEREQQAPQTRHVQRANHDHRSFQVHTWRRR